MLGRSAECAVPLRHASVSRQHAHLELDGGTWWVVDKSSRNGLTVRGQRVLRAPMEDGDEFQLGEVLLRFRLASPPVTSPLPRDEAPHDQPPVVVRDPTGATAHDEIVLEGEWDAEATVPARQMNIAGPAMAPPPAEVPRMETARQRATAKLTAAGAMPKGTTGGRGILQFNKVEAREGFMASELGQQPWWIKAAVAVLVLVVCAAVAWVAFRGTVWLRGGPKEPPAIEER
jgi:hypothetical protein